MITSQRECSWLGNAIARRLVCDVQKITTIAGKTYISVGVGDGSVDKLGLKLGWNDGKVLGIFEGISDGDSDG